SRIRDSNDPNGVAADLGVLYTDTPTPGATTELALLHGSPQRTMVGYYDPDQQRLLPYSGVVAGHFHDQTAIDLLAFEQVTTGDTFVFLSHGANAGIVNTGTPTLATRI